MYQLKLANELLKEFNYKVILKALRSLKTVYSLKHPALRSKLCEVQKIEENGLKVLTESPKDTTTGEYVDIVLVNEIKLDRPKTRRGLLD